MAIVNGSLELGYKDLAWFTANPTLVLKEGQIVYLEQTGTYKIGNGVSTLSALSFLGVSSETQTLQNVTDLGSITTNSITANGFVKTGGTSSQFLKADGSVDSTTYISGITSGMVTTALGFTPYNSTNPSGYITGITSGMVITALGFTPYDASNPSGYITSSALTSYVPYTGATGNVNLGTHNLTASDLIINHASGSGVAASITKGGSGEALTVVKSSGSGNAASITGGVTLISELHLTTDLADTYIASASTWNDKQDALSGTGFVKSTAGVISYDTNTYLTTSSASSTYVPYTGATANVNLGTNTLTTPTINGVSGLLSFGSTDRVSVGNYATPLSQRAFTVGQDTAWMTIGSCTDLTSQIGLFFGSTSFAFSNASLRGNNSSTVLNTPNSNGLVFLKTNGVDRFVVSGVNASDNAFNLSAPNNTGRTAGLSIAGWNYQSFSRQWATGNITTQSENVWGATTYSFVGASTITNAYGNVFNAPIAGTNATITNNFAARFNGQLYLTQTVTTETVVQTRTVTIVINGTTYKLLAA